MDLIPITEREARSGAVRLDPARLEKIGVRFAVAERIELVRSVRALGRVTRDGGVDLQTQDLRRISPGQKATVRLPGDGGSVEARVVDESRLDLRNRTLKPGTLLDVVFPIALGKRLSVPTSAVIVAGERRVVFVERGPGVLEPRTVRTGLVAGERIEVTDGLAPGERVVASGTFLIAAESRVQSALEQW